ncbi:GTPase Era [Phreatobacter cathodiphilus]|uniref:GTPase Era n=1 Tax=Phreatobacter cathodiphilus TaxID=1868589 RepID=A0A2S0NA94_9HYPH|nr:GTPase Era [Phreatobacter cathodiphilus]AVO45016.1 GTPase Era [Phreatobacter cathodiphilus]
MTETTTRCGFVAIIGAPNAGKSTLVNALVGAKVTIVSHKVQTTRALVRGIAMEGASQIILVDTPGLFSPKRRLDRAMVSAAWGGAADADRVLVLVDAKKGIDEPVDAILDKLGDIRQPMDLVLNKVDLVERPKLLDLATAVNARARFDQTFMISSTTGSGVMDLKRHLAAVVPAGPWHYPEDEISDVPARMLAAEITREKLYHRLHDELPYDATVETESYEERKDGSIRIEQTIYVVREGQRKIMLGKRGETIKLISTSAREELSKLFETKVHLFLFVKVRENWGDDPERYERMGLEYPKGR